METTERRRAFIINTVYWALIALIIYACLKYVLGWLTPFITGFVVAFALNPLVSFISRKTKLKRKPVAMLTVIFFFASAGTGLGFLIAFIYRSVRSWAYDLPFYYRNVLMPALSNVEGFIAENLTGLFPKWDISGDGSQLVAMLGDYISSFSSSLLKWLTGITASAPLVLVGVVFSILLSVFLSGYYKETTGFIIRQLPKRARELVYDVKSALGSTVARYIGAYFKIMCITFVELSIGLSIVRQEVCVLQALGIAVFDIFPVFGTGGILIPWVIIDFLGGEYMRALGMLIVYVIITVVRNFIEPKIIGDQLGLNPVVAVLSIYLGFRWIGVVGMILVPIIVQIALKLYKDGRLNFIFPHKNNPEPKEEGIQT